MIITVNVIQDSYVFAGNYRNIGTPFTPNPYGKVEAPQLGVHPAYKNFAVVSPLVASNSYFQT